jgi:hypothetical protein
LSTNIDGFDFTNTDWKRFRIKETSKGQSQQGAEKSQKAMLMAHF